MGSLLHRFGALAGAMLLVSSGDAVGLGVFATTQGYRFRGMAAPQIQPQSLAADLLLQLQRLRQQLRERAVETTLNDALEQSLLHNPQLALAYSQIQQQQWSLIAVRRLWYPTLTAASEALPDFGSRRIRSTTTTATGELSTLTTADQTRRGAGLNLNWTFFNPSRGPLIQAAGEDLRSQELLFNVAARNLVLQTQLDYFELQEQVQLIAAFEQILATSNRQVSQVEALFNIGSASIADVEQIRTSRYETLTLLIKTYQTLIASSASLATAMALPVGRLVLPAEPLQTYGEWTLPLAQSLEQALALREEIQSSLAKASSARWRASALTNSYLPQFSLNASGLTSDTITNTSVSAGRFRLEDSLLYGVVGIGFRWNLFDGGIAAAEASSSRALSQFYADQASLERLQVVQEVEQSHAGYETSRLALQSTQSQMNSASKALVAVQERFNVGYADITTVVQTLTQSIAAANAFSSAKRLYNIAVARLYRSSAQWPGNTLLLRDQRVERLKQR